MSNTLTEKFKSHLQGINFKKLEKIFFALFLLSIPLQTRLTFNTPQTYLNGTFNEYATFFLYLSDILFIITLLFFFVNILTFTNYFNVIKQGFRSSPHLIPIIFLLITLITWSFIDIIWVSHKNIAFYQAIKLIEFALLFLYIKQRLYWFGINRTFVLIFISGYIESVIGIGQYILQKSLGLKILMESVLSPDLPNVAKIIVDGARIIRAYGTFPHPNVFSGFLILSIFCGIWLLFSRKTANAYKIVSRPPSEASIYSKILACLKEKKTIVSRETISAPAKAGKTIYGEAKAGETILYAFFIIGIIIQLIAFILTFSRIAWLTLILIILVYIFLLIKLKLFHACSSMLAYFLKKLFSLKQNMAIVSRETILLKRSRVKQFYHNTFNKMQKYSIIIITFSFVLTISLFWNQINSRAIDIGNKYQQSINYRIMYDNMAILMIKAEPLTGIGNGNFTLKMKDYSPIPLEWWQYQPAHDIYLLIASEMGLTGLIIFLTFIFQIIKNAYLKRNNQIVSRPPSEASIYSKILACLKEKKTIVSRETIYGEAKADGTILAQTNKTEMHLLQLGLISIFVGFLFIGLFDHYFWTLQQGQLTFWLVLGVLSATANKN